MLCNPLKVNRCFGKTSPPSSGLKNKPSKSIRAHDFQRTGWRYIPEDTALHNHRCELNMKFNRNPSSSFTDEREGKVWPEHTFCAFCAKNAKEPKNYVEASAAVGNDHKGHTWAWMTTLRPNFVKN
jgi:hypothetical protein